MHEKLKKFLDAKKAVEKKRYEAAKKQALIELGLYEKVYSPDDRYSEEFCHSEWDSENQTNKYYKKAPIEVTDEEFLQVKKYVKNEEITESNQVAAALTVIAWVILSVGCIAGMIIMIMVRSFTMALICWCSSLISGTMFLGFAEIIKLLEAIKRK